MKQFKTLTLQQKLIISYYLNGWQYWKYGAEYNKKILKVNNLLGDLGINFWIDSKNADDVNAIMYDEKDFENLKNFNLGVDPETKYFNLYETYVFYKYGSQKEFIKDQTFFKLSNSFGSLYLSSKHFGSYLKAVDSQNNKQLTLNYVIKNI